MASCSTPPDSEPDVDSTFVGVGDAAAVTRDTSVGVGDVADPTRDASVGVGFGAAVLVAQEGGSAQAISNSMDIAKT